MSLETFLFQLIIILVIAKVFGQIMHRLGQPFVLGELLGGALFGVYGLGLIQHYELTELLAQIGLIILLFEIGLETDLDTLIKLGPRSMMVALAGIVLPFGGGFFFAQTMGLETLPALLIGGALSATSIGISIRALAELGESKSVEGQVVLGAALIDDVVGLLILAIITTLASSMGKGGEVSLDILGLVITLLFPMVAVLIGSWLAKPLITWVDRMTVRGATVIISLVMAFSFAYVAKLIGSSPIIGAFAAGLILARTHRSNEIETQLKPIADLFTPIFFVTIGASLNIQLLNPFDADNHSILLIALGLSFIGFFTKFASGFMCRGEGIRHAIIGVSMVPRGEVVLIFANMGLSQGLLSPEWFAVLILLIFATATSSPFILKQILGKASQQLDPSQLSLLIPGHSSEERL